MAHVKIKGLTGGGLARSTRINLLSEAEYKEFEKILLRLSNRPRSQGSEHPNQVYSVLKDETIGFLIRSAIAECYTYYVGAQDWGFENFKAEALLTLCKEVYLHDGNIECMVNNSNFTWAAARELLLDHFETDPPIRNQFVAELTDEAVNEDFLRKLVAEREKVGVDDSVIAERIRRISREYIGMPDAWVIEVFS
jgi:hypothetical protein